jgi:hypothetical protein
MRSTLVVATLVLALMTPTNARPQTTTALVCDRYPLSSVPISASETTSLDTEANEIISVNTDNLTGYMINKIKGFQREQKISSVKTAKAQYYVHAVCLQIEQDSTRDSNENSKRLSSIDSALHLLYFQKKYRVAQPEEGNPSHHHAPDSDIGESHTPDAHPKIDPAK